MEMVGKKNRLAPSKWALTVMALAIASAAVAGTFTFELASPVAAQDFRFKTAPFVFRTAGCGAGVRPDLSASAEGIVQGMRQSKPLQIVESTVKPGVFGIPQPLGIGKWVIVLKGTCGAVQAGAIVPVGVAGFMRDAVRITNRYPSSAEIDTSLRALP